MHDRFLDLAREEGEPRFGYRAFVDLRECEVDLPARLYCHGKYTGIHKLELVGTAFLGLPRAREVVESVFPHLSRVKISRIDLALDILGISAWKLAMNCRIPTVQNFRLFRSRAAVSMYLRASNDQTLLIYDRGRQLRRIRHPLARVLHTDDCLSRVEVQFKRRVPFKRFLDLERYADIDLLGNLEFAKLTVPREGWTPAQQLACEGLRYRVAKFGLQAVSKQFSSSEWAAIKKAYLKPMKGVRFPNLEALMRKSNADWFAGRIRFPRTERNPAEDTE